MPKKFYWLPLFASCIILIVLPNITVSVYDWNRITVADLNTNKCDELLAKFNATLIDNFETHIRSLIELIRKLSMTNCTEEFDGIGKQINNLWREEFEEIQFANELLENCSQFVFNDSDLIKWKYTYFQRNWADHLINCSIPLLEDGLKSLVADAILDAMLKETKQNLNEILPKINSKLALKKRIGDQQPENNNKFERSRLLQIELCHIFRILIKSIDNFLAEQLKNKREPKLSLSPPPESNVILTENLKQNKTIPKANSKVLLFDLIYQSYFKTLQTTFEEFTGKKLTNLNLLFAISTICSVVIFGGIGLGCILISGQNSTTGLGNSIKINYNISTTTTSTINLNEISLIVLFLSVLIVLYLMGFILFYLHNHYNNPKNQHNTNLKPIINYENKQQQQQLLQQVPKISLHRPKYLHCQSFRSSAFADKSHSRRSPSQHLSKSNHQSTLQNSNVNWFDSKNPTTTINNNFAKKSKSNYRNRKLLESGNNPHQTKTNSPPRTTFVDSNVNWLASDNYNKSRNKSQNDNLSKW